MLWQRPCIRSCPRTGRRPMHKIQRPCPGTGRRRAGTSGETPRFKNTIRGKEDNICSMSATDSKTIVWWKFEALHR